MAAADGTTLQVFILTGLLMHSAGITCEAEKLAVDWFSKSGCIVQFNGVAATAALKIVKEQILFFESNNPYNFVVKHKV